MTVRIEKPALNLREELAALRNRCGYSQVQFWFTGNGTTAAFALEKGWSPLHVFNAGLLKRPGTGNDYTVSFDGFVYTVTFAVAPASGNNIGIIAGRA